MVYIATYIIDDYIICIDISYQYYEMRICQQFKRFNILLFKTEETSVRNACNALNDIPL